MCWACATLPATVLPAVRMSRPARPAGEPAADDLRLTVPGRGPSGVGVAAGIGLVVLGLILVVPDSVQFSLDVLGYGICHQLRSHSLILGGHPLPVCARCTGIYLGTVVTWILLTLLHPRAIGLPARRMWPLLGLMFATMVVDGVNSTFQSLPGGQGLWETTNFLRIVTGTLAGSALGFVLYPVAQASLWHPHLVRREGVLDDPWELFPYGAVLAVVVGLAFSAVGDPAAGWLYWPLALLSAVGFLGLLAGANLLFGLLLTRRERRIGTTAQAWQALGLMLIAALIEIGCLSYLRMSLLGNLATSGQFLGDLPPGPGIR